MTSESQSASSFTGALPIPYTAEEVGRTFADLLDTLDFAAELQDLGISSLRVFKRRQAKKHFRAVCIALWHIALEKSFPNDAEAFFAHFMTTSPLVSAEQKNARKLRAMVETYDALLVEKKDADFTTIAEEITRQFEQGHEEQRRHQLKLSLRIRAIYDLIFDKLI